MMGMTVKRFFADEVLRPSWKGEQANQTRNHIAKMFH